MSKVHTDLKRRRLELVLKQDDMEGRAGMSRQQYQRLESKGNPRLDTLELIAKGLNLELRLIPQEKLQAVDALLNQGKDSSKRSALLDEDPWQDLLLDDNDRDDER